jgi:hypothetical protein
MQEEHFQEIRANGGGNWLTRSLNTTGGFTMVFYIASSNPIDADGGNYGYYRFLVEQVRVLMMNQAEPLALCGKITTMQLRW